MTTVKVQGYRQLILDGIEGLPERALAEIVDFIGAVRGRELSEDENDTFHQISLGVERSRFSRKNQLHLEEEFAGYEQLYPLSEETRFVRFTCLNPDSSDQTHRAGRRPGN